VTLEREVSRIGLEVSLEGKVSRIGLELRSGLDLGRDARARAVVCVVLFLLA
jgi:hypothetical protein